MTVSPVPPATMVTVPPRTTPADVELVSPKMLMVLALIVPVLYRPFLALVVAVMSIVPALAVSTAAVFPMKPELA